MPRAPSIGAIDPPIAIIAATRAAADEFALSIANDAGATFGITRSSVAELVARLAVPALARKGLTPSAPLSDEAVSARVTHDLMTNDGAEIFFAGRAHARFPARAEPNAGRAADGRDRSAAAGRARCQRRSVRAAHARDRRAATAGAVDYATMLQTATEELQSRPDLLGEHTVVLLDVAISTQAEASFIKAVIAAAGSVIATIPSGDVGTLAAPRHRTALAPAGA